MPDTKQTKPNDGKAKDPKAATGSANITEGLDKQDEGSGERTGVFSNPRPRLPGYGGSESNPPGSGFSAQ